MILMFWSDDMSDGRLDVTDSALTHITQKEINYEIDGENFSTITRAAGCSLANFGL